MYRNNRLTGVIAAFLLFSSLTAADDNQLTEQEKLAGWQLLFNGKDLAGWKCNNGKQVATAVEEGSIVPYKSGGYIVVHEKTVRKFRFKIRCSLGGSGLQFGLLFPDRGSLESCAYRI